MTWTTRLRHLYEAQTRDARHFRYGLLAFDFFTILFVTVTSFLPRSQIIEVVDALIGLAILADLIARCMVSDDKFRYLVRPATLLDLLVAVSLLAPVGGRGAAFLRILRTLRLFHSYQMLAQLRADSRLFARYEEVILAVLNMYVFIFIMTGVVYETQYRTNPNISNYADALYFTVTALTTTGFGDITLPGTVGRMITVVIMISGVTLFLRLAQVLFRPQKVLFPCPACGLRRHEPDAVHCKACGIVLNIPDDGE